MNQKIPQSGEALEPDAKFRIQKPNGDECGYYLAIRIWHRKSATRKHVMSEIENTLGGHMQRAFGGKHEKGIRAFTVGKCP